MRQVNPIKTFAGEYIPQSYATYAKYNGLNFQCNNKHSQLFETNHGINKVKKFIVKSNMTCKSLCHSLTSFRLHHYTHETFPLLPTPTNKANTSSEQNMSEKLRAKHSISKLEHSQNNDNEN